MRRAVQQADRPSEAEFHRSGIGWPGLLLAAGGTALAAIGIRRITGMRTIAADLRSPLLLIPMTMSSRTMPLFRRFQELAPTPSVPDRVRKTEHQATGRDGNTSVRVLVFERKDSKGSRPALLWFHGGGYVTGLPEQDAAILSLILDRLDCVIVSVDYRLAPEHPFPAALDDARAALDWMYANHESLGVDTRRIAIGGQSAGGGLAAAVVQQAIDEGPVKPVFQLLMYPMLDAATTRRRDHGDRGWFVWTPASNRYGWESYLGRDPEHPAYPTYANPASRSDLSGMPATWIGVGTADLFHDEDVTYGRRLQAAGNPCEIVTVPGAYHAFDLFKPEADASRRFHASMMSALADKLLLPVRG